MGVTHATQLGRAPPCLRGLWTNTYLIRAPNVHTSSAEWECGAGAQGRSVGEVAAAGSWKSQKSFTRVTERIATSHENDAKWA